MLAALGYRFLDRDGDLLAPRREPGPHPLRRLASRAIDLQGIEFVVAGDDASLLGLTGAAVVFGPRKGANEAAVAELDAGSSTLSSPSPAPGLAGARDWAHARGSGPPAASAPRPRCSAPPPPRGPNTSWTCSISTATSLTPTWSSPAKVGSTARPCREILPAAVALRAAPVPVHPRRRLQRPGQRYRHRVRRCLRRRRPHRHRHLPRPATHLQNLQHIGFRSGPTQAQASSMRLSRTMQHWP